MTLLPSHFSEELRKKLEISAVVMKSLIFSAVYNIFKEIDQKVLENLWRATTFKKERTKTAYSK
jgi:hypothetical protein